jgi:hypothetical protein
VSDLRLADDIRQNAAHRRFERTAVIIGHPGPRVG